MHTQNLRDNKWDIENTYYNKRGWTNSLNWQICWNKALSNPYAKFMVTLGGEDTQAVNISMGFLGLSIYLTFNKLLPKQYEIGWYSRNDVKNPLWHEDSHGRSYGFYFLDTSIHFNWNSSNAGSGKGREWGYSKHFFVPWDWDSAVRWEVVNEEGKLVTKIDQYGEGPFKDGRRIYTYPYKYTLKNGTVQNRTATIHEYEMEWRWRMFKKLRIGPKILKHSIDVKFNDEVGERTGSWKGGTIGCSYEMLPGETPRQTLHRMEKEREF